MCNEFLSTDFFLKEWVSSLIEMECAELLFQIEAHQNSRNPYWSAAQYLEHFKSEDRIYINPEKTAFVIYRMIANELEITHWAVKEKGKGGGRIFFSRFLYEVGSRASRVVLECGEWNAAALKLYTSLSFEKSGFRHKYYQSGEGAWVMERILAA